MAPSDLLPVALAALIDATGADRGFLEFRRSDAAGRVQRLFTAHGVDAKTESRGRDLVSNGIVAETLQRGEVVLTACAVDDARFSARESVQTQQIQAVLCAPLGDPSDGGFIYLERSRPFEADARPRAQGWVDAMAPFVRRAEPDRAAARTADPTAEARRVLDCQELVGRSQALADMLDHVLMARVSQAPVLITGPTGSGKSTVAGLVHRSSRRAAGPFQVHNAATFTGSLASSALFGVGRGAATQVQARAGALAEADGGTLFLDEVARLSLDVQAQLLTFLDTGEYRRVGEDAVRRADVRVVAATNEPLDERVASGDFRDDLLYRFDVLRVPVPGLNERPDDVPLLAASLVVGIAESEGLAPLPLDDDVGAWLRDRAWPGHVRQLRSELHRALLRASAGDAPVVGVRHFGSPGASSQSERPCPTQFRAATEWFQRDFLIGALAEHKGNRSATARAIGLSRSRLYELIAELGLGDAE